MLAMSTPDPGAGRPEPGDSPAPPGDSPAPQGPRDARRLAEPPSARYAPRPGPEATSDTGGSALIGPLVRAAVVAIGGAVLLTLVGAIFASTAGLLFVAGIAGAATGLVLSRAAAPGEGGGAVPRRRVAWIAIGLSIGAVAVAALATWIYARSEGGTLGLLDYLLTTFGPFVPAEALIAAVTAWWGASTGPVQR